MPITPEKRLVYDARLAYYTPVKFLDRNPDVARVYTHGSPDTCGAWVYTV